jgi:hypothetical protein
VAGNVGGVLSVEEEVSAKGEMRTTTDYDDEYVNGESGGKEIGMRDGRRRSQQTDSPPSIRTTTRLATA